MKGTQPRKTSEATSIQAVLEHQAREREALGLDSLCPWKERAEEFQPAAAIPRPPKKKDKKGKLRLVHLGERRFISSHAASSQSTYIAQLCLATPRTEPAAVDAGPLHSFSMQTACPSSVPALRSLAQLALLRYHINAQSGEHTLARRLVDRIVTDLRQTSSASTALLKGGQNGQLKNRWGYAGAKILRLMDEADRASENTFSFSSSHTIGGAKTSLVPGLQSAHAHRRYQQPEHALKS